ncbi:MAG TPA: class II aldolase/adducin family protein [Orrella sp.]
MSWPDLPENLMIAAEQVVQAGKSLRDRGYVHGTTGNISLRVRTDQFSGYLITPTDACLGHLDANKLAAVDEQGQQHFGARASKTVALHQAIYTADPNANAVIHTHSHHLVLLTLLGVWKASSILPPMTPYQVMKVGPVPLIGYAVPGHESVVHDVSQRIHGMAQRGVTLRAVMCDRLGPQVWHRDLTNAMATLEELEQTARLWIDANRDVQPMARSQLDALRERFGCVWAD